jgi:hypothetical protein
MECKALLDTEHGLGLKQIYPLVDPRHLLIAELAILYLHAVPACVVGVDPELLHQPSERAPSVNSTGHAVVQRNAPFGEQRGKKRVNNDVEEAREKVCINESGEPRTCSVACFWQVGTFERSSAHLGPSLSSIGYGSSHQIPGTVPN